MTRISGKTALVTGGASGMGRLMAMKLARRGARVVIYDLDEAAIEEAVREAGAYNGGRAYGYVCDVSDREMVYEVADRVRREVGDVEILINNAGVVTGKTLMEAPDEQIERVFKVNALALYWVTKSFLGPMMEKNEGHIVTIASAAGIIGVSKQTDYSASKHAAVGFTESLRVELKRYGYRGIRTTIVSPYYVDTGMFRGVKTRFPIVSPYYVDTGMFRGVKTRFPRVLPILDPDRVAEKVMRMIERNRQEIKMPFIVTTVPALHVLPANLLDRIMDFFGVNHSMDEFVGREGEPERPVPVKERA
ncbi:SDR family oxidoreductase [Rubrobacter naiadicus]|uniref:SDR family oxidoreductase n=1 Tax=Rubrobacter naiadicus TaxID=1392641 RepID=UPI00235E2F2B|nr:SDR family oxidoreductase [Rubrobacter naiadicus]